MSKCISGQGEYSDHTPGDEEFVCGRCYVVDEEAMQAEIERLRTALTADRPTVSETATEATERIARQIAATTAMTGLDARECVKAVQAIQRAETTTATPADLTVTDAARAEAWRRFPDGIDVETGEPVDDYGYPATAREAFIAGAEWAAGHAESIPHRDELAQAVMEATVPFRGPGGQTVPYVMPVHYAIADAVLALLGGDNRG